ncbi:tetratricopeptide repeat protein [Tolypothrix sp. FACHB-123]|uniref:CHAT domain-containing protein n=1 Tax=Tolypothrix sp. FACHB-123 TaxID=2692868 RepID=UPI0016838CD1|nr:tetratricopeptide repeat protein [Tolypothrix sp. FACHB-123]MBD2353385.1 tetratricopeptide repeat protein [Tolypothrix sp. FACHB-123]
MYLKFKYCSAIVAILLSLFFPQPKIIIGKSILLAQTSPNSKLQANTLSQEANKLLRQGKFLEAIELFKQALAIRQAIKDRMGETFSLYSIGKVYSKTGQYSQALEAYQQALAIRRQIGAKAGEVDILYKIAEVYEKMGHYPKALEYYQQALNIAKDVGSRTGESDTLNGIGAAYRSVGNYAQALDYHQQALAIARKTNDQIEEAESLNKIGVVHRHLGDYTKALELYQQALTIAKRIGDRFLEGDTLGNIGVVYDYAGQYSQALDYYQQALTIFQQIRNRQLIGITLNNIGSVHHSMGKYTNAVEFYQQALNITREGGSRATEASILGNMGLIYRHQNDYAKALDIYQQALAIQREIGDKPGESITLSNLGTLLERQQQSELAIAFYKQSVNVTEDIRRSLRVLPGNLQKSYTENVASKYRRLADLLLRQNRPVEAQQILDLLKIQEANEYLNQSRGNNNNSASIDLLSQEQKIVSQLQSIQGKEIELGKQLVALRQTCQPECTTNQQQRIAELEQLQQQTRKQFNTFINSTDVKSLVRQLNETAQEQNLRLSHLNKLRSNLPKDTVLLYPLVLDDRIEIVLVSHYTPPVRRTSAVNKQVLNQKIAEFRQALTQRTSNPKKSASQLYDWLIKPIESDLKQAQAKTIIYAPDAQLRYIPLAALYDGQKWLIERFGIYNITAASIDDLKTQRQTNLRALAGAFSQGNYSFQVGSQSFNFDGLTYAGKEVEILSQIIKNTTKILDKEFSPATFVAKFNNYNIVHLATHATFTAGKPEESFILFGNGERVTLLDVEDWNLSNVDLIVLSACETGVGDRLGNGEEILGFGYLMQLAGAKTTVASLWVVDDGGTQALMNEFYAALQNTNITKSQAIRQAQLALITGDFQFLDRVKKQINSTPNISANFKHPYYWAPFILIGNGL